MDNSGLSNTGNDPSNVANKGQIGTQGGLSTSGSATMTKDQPVGQKVKQGWNEFKAKVTGKWHQLKGDNTLDSYSGKTRNDFVGYVHGKVGGDRSLVERDVDGFAKETKYQW